MTWLPYLYCCSVIRFLGSWRYLGIKIFAIKSSLFLHYFLRGTSRWDPNDEKLFVEEFFLEFFVYHVMWTYKIVAACKFQELEFFVELAWFRFQSAQEIRHFECVIRSRWLLGVNPVLVVPPMTVKSIKKDNFYLSILRGLFHFRNVLFKHLQMKLNNLSAGRKKRIRCRVLLLRLKRGAKYMHFSGYHIFTKKNEKNK